MSYPISSSNQEDDNVVEHYVITVPPELHRDTAELVASGAEALAAKLERAQRKYGYSTHWLNPENIPYIKKDMYVHLDKGDPLDVMAFALFLWHHKASTVIEPKGVVDMESLIGG